MFKVGDSVTIKTEEDWEALKGDVGDEVFGRIMSAIDSKAPLRILLVKEEEQYPYTVERTDTKEIITTFHETELIGVKTRTNVWKGGKR